MTNKSKLLLSKRIEEDFEKHCDKFDEWCTKCPYTKSGIHCEIEFTLNYLNKRKKLKEKNK